MTEDNELIEIMARAICDVTRVHNGWEPLKPHEKLTDAGTYWYEEQARAALTAYRNHQVEL